MLCGPGSAGQTALLELGGSPWGPAERGGSCGVSTLFAGWGVVLPCVRVRVRVRS